ALYDWYQLPLLDAPEVPPEDARPVILFAHLFLIEMEYRHDHRSIKECGLNRHRGPRGHHEVRMPQHVAHLHHLVSGHGVTQSGDVALHVRDSQIGMISTVRELFDARMWMKATDHLRPSGNSAGVDLLHQPFDQVRLVIAGHERTGGRQRDNRPVRIKSESR